MVPQQDGWPYKSKIYNKNALLYLTLELTLSVKLGVFIIENKYLRGWEMVVISKILHDMEKI